LGKISQDIGLP